MNNQSDYLQSKYKNNEIEFIHLYLKINVFINTEQQHDLQEPYLKMLIRLVNEQIYFDLLKKNLTGMFAIYNINIILKS